MQRSIALLTVMLLSGCATVTPQPHIQKASGLTIMSTTAEVEGLVIKDHGSPERMCAGRRVIAGDSASFSLGLSDGKDEIKESGSQDVASLGGISPAVLIVSEIMYRTCELSLNVNLSKEETLDLYRNTIEAVKILSVPSQSEMTPVAPLP